MGYQKLKAEHYVNLGGINQKASAYILGDKEFIDIENLDFQNPGALSKRWGFTAAYTPSASFAVGASQAINAIWQTTTSRVVPSASFQPGLRTLNLFGFNSGVAAVSGTLQGATLVPWITGVTNAVWDHSEFIDATYYSYGSAGVTLNTAYKNVAGDTQPYLFGMITPPFGSSASGLTVTATTAGTSFTGTYVYQYAYLDAVGFVGQLGSTFAYSTAGANTINLSGFTTVNPGPPSANALAYGATAYVLFRNRVDGFPSQDLVSIGYIPVTSTTITDQFPPSFDVNTYSPYPYPDINRATIYSPLESNRSIDPGFNKWDVSEVYANRLWINFRAYQLAFSELENLQFFLPENIRVFSNNNFRVTGLKNYNQSLMVLCQKGIFRLTGDTPDNFNISEMSTEYGCVSDKACIVFNEKMWFLDYEMIVQFNGSNIDDMGNRVEGYLKRMNKATAYRLACAMHLPERNEVWFSIPIDGSDINNITLVYDYLADGWTTFRGTKLKATALGTLYFGQSITSNQVSTEKSYYFGSIGGSMYRFGSQFKNDDGTGMTLSYQTKFHNELGKSQTAQFRRFYQDIGSYAGPTLTFGLDFYSNYSTSAIAYTTSMSYNVYQNRIDFGIPAKSLSIRVAHGSTQGDLQINGYTVEFRFQRAV